MIFGTFLRRSDRSKTQNRIEPVSLPVAEAGLPAAPGDDRRKRDLAATFLLDDVSPKVRMSLAEALADDNLAPRPVILALTEDRTDIAAMIVSRSPVLTDNDLIDLVGRGSSEIRAAVAVRAVVSVQVAGALAEVGGRLDIALLLRNPGTRLTPNVMVRLASRCGKDATIRELLLERPELPATARHILVEKIGATLTDADLVTALIPPRKRERMRREACEAALVRVLAGAGEAELAEMVEHLRVEGRLSTMFLIHALCAGRTAFFAEVISNLSGVARVRARAILASGRPRAVRALIEAAGIDRDVSDVFCEAVSIWREEGGDIPGDAGIFLRLAERCRQHADAAEAAHALIDAVERLAISEMRQMAKAYVHDLLTQAA
ncbi:Uncharacterized conserved protein, DUF2336 family [Ensifer adhaerens]|nr:Uncharacterized conserved protein, DUF2336 family [Ensifer adhaerens]